MFADSSQHLFGVVRRKDAQRRPRLAAAQVPGLVEIKEHFENSFMPAFDDGTANNHPLAGLKHENVVSFGQQVYTEPDFLALVRVPWVVHLRLEKFQSWFGAINK